MKKIFFSIVFSSFFLCLNAQESIRFGVFAYKGVEETKKQYEPLAAYLNEKLDHRVVLEVLTQQEMDEKIKKNELDFITTNPRHFLVIRQAYHLSGAIATLEGFKSGVATSRLAGVIITKKDTPINTLKELKNKKISIPSKKHMGGFSVPTYELYLEGITIAGKNIVPSKTHKEAVYAVLEGSADAAFIRDGILEEMVDNGLLQEELIKIINEQKNRVHPYRISTRLYPEWPVFAMPHVDKRVAKEFGVALLSLPPTKKIQDAGINGYVLPADYLEVEELTRALRLPPFDKMQEITYLDIFEQYKMTLIAMLLALFMAISYYTKERKSKNLFASLLNNMGEGVYGVDKEGNCIWINPKALELLGYAQEEVLYKEQHRLFHHHRPDNTEYPLEECPTYLTRLDKITRTSKEWFIKKDGSFFSCQPHRYCYAKRRSYRRVSRYQRFYRKRECAQKQRKPL